LKSRTSPAEDAEFSISALRRRAIKKGVVNALDATSKRSFTRSITRPRGGKVLSSDAPIPFRAVTTGSNFPDLVSTTTANQRLEVSIRGSEKEKEQQEEEITSPK
jgi:hypothetical protein